MFQKTYDIKAVPAARPRVGKRVMYPKTYAKFRQDWAIYTHSDWQAIYAETKDAREYEFSYEAWFKLHPKADIDNVFKALTDTLVKAKVVPDDNLITKSTITKHFNSGKEQVRIVINKIK
ncbi:RusA family crossover junction endodeoxyribonuclease [Oenococcus sicerae]|uniref:RusA family crossover junction endodeoxyribonuclease n=1 Tax=Oenococcus sicerae TaxID=2203724 RepID=UPI001FAD5E54|nr:RusA family crossover junction endodeoxyribonuclease [Oenococcus sicerae]